MTEPFRSVAVYCGSSPGADPAFALGAAELGRCIASRGLRLVYGGGRVGLMGILADAALDEGGEVRGVITRALLDKEVAHHGLTTLEVVETMHERKAVMSDLADGFVMLPGGYGTLDEFFEALTWTQLGVHAKPCGVLDINGYFGPLVDFLETATRERFVTPEHRDMIITASAPGPLLDDLAAWQRPPTGKWLDRTER